MSTTVIVFLAYIAGLAARFHDRLHLLRGLSVLIIPGMTGGFAFAESGPPGTRPGPACGIIPLRSRRYGNPPPPRPKS